MNNIGHYAKAIVSVLFGALTVGGNIVATSYGFSPTTVTAVLSALSSVFVYMVPNKPAVTTTPSTTTTTTPVV